MFFFWGEEEVRHTHRGDRNPATRTASPQGAEPEPEPAKVPEPEPKPNLGQRPSRSAAAPEPDKPEPLFAIRTALHNARIVADPRISYKTG